MTRSAHDHGDTPARQNFGSGSHRRLQDQISSPEKYWNCISKSVTMGTFYVNFGAACRNRFSGKYGHRLITGGAATICPKKPCKPSPKRSLTSTVIKQR
jgi:hypothetical protein